ncbi:hypothetical protein NPIL_486441 [Nephila pilipes]|uniref:Uncharacterized protein n=1 Tax=Nephila pilipes TaxID=299642 RepID=A0A8X6QB35_NEPPI|nr:hypothetical protein NPIL_486441 [Nephila pilipes]
MSFCYVPSVQKRIRCCFQDIRATLEKIAPRRWERSSMMMDKLRKFSSPLFAVVHVSDPPSPFEHTHTGFHWGRRPSERVPAPLRRIEFRRLR